MKKHKKAGDSLTKGKRHLSKEWQKAVEDAKLCSTPWRDLDHSRPERARAAYAAICLAGTDEFPGVKKHPKMKKFRKELKDKGHIE